MVKAYKLIRYLSWTTYGFLLLGVIVAGAAVGLIFGYAVDLPQVDQLEEIRPNVVSYVHADDGRILGQFALERRILVSYDQIPDLIKQAILATEDANFFRHTGIDFRRLLVALIRDIVYGERKGASTLTMQLSKLRFTSPEQTPERKIKDMLFAIEIEKTYSKEQIFTFYCNQIYLGHGNYGIAAAADFYFHKPPDQLTLTEAALLAGINNSPIYASPIDYPQRALARRNYALRRMFEEGYIDAEAMKEAIQQPVVVYGKNQDQGPAPYFVEWVRQELEKKYQTEDIWKGGLRIHTTVNYDMQVAARQALRGGLKRFDKQTRRWSGPVENILEHGKDLDAYVHSDWSQILYEGQMMHGLVLESGPRQSRVKFGTFSAVVEPDDIQWTGQKVVSRVIKKGDVALFSIDKIDRSEKLIEVTLDREPLVQGAFMTIDNKTGAIKTMVGGFDFQHSKFNRATQALRQPGSIFKPFTYVAAMESGYSPYDTVLDAPVNFPDALGRPYSPKNSDGEFKGLITVRQAIALSRNVPTIRLANAMGIRKVIDVAHRFGMRRDFPPYLPVALGAGEVTLQEITSAFTTFSNKGVRALPYFIERVEDYHGVTLDEHRHQVEEAISPEVADKMVFLLRGVVEAGTATSAKQLGRPLGGKTGTTDDATDSWFVGFTPQITAGVWVGYDEKKSLGARVFGATLALPIWIDFMKEALKDLPVEDFETNFTPASVNLAKQTPTTEQPKEAKTGAIVVEDIKPPPM